MARSLNLSPVSGVGRTLRLDQNPVVRLGTATDSRCRNGPKEGPGMRSLVGRKLEMGARVRTFSRTHPSTDPEYPPVLGLLEDVSRLVAEFDTASEAARVTRLEHIAARADLEAATTELMEQVKLLNGINRWRFGKDPKLLVEWNAAKHVAGAGGGAARGGGGPPPPSAGGGAGAPPPAGGGAR